MYAFIFRREPAVEIPTGFTTLKCSVGNLQEYKDTTSLYKKVVNLENKEIEVEEKIRGVVITTVARYQYQRKFFGTLRYEKKVSYKEQKIPIYFDEIIWNKLKSTDALSILEKELRESMKLNIISLSIRIHNKISISMETKEFDFKKINRFCTAMAEQAYNMYIEEFISSIAE